MHCNFNLVIWIRQQALQKTVVNHLVAVCILDNAVRVRSIRGHCDVVAVHTETAILFGYHHYHSRGKKCRPARPGSPRLSRKEHPPPPCLWMIINMKMMMMMVRMRKGVTLVTSSTHLIARTIRYLSSSLKTGGPWKWLLINHLPHLMRTHHSLIISREGLIVNPSLSTGKGLLIHSLQKDWWWENVRAPPKPGGIGKSQGSREILRVKGVDFSDSDSESVTINPSLLMMRERKIIRFLTRHISVEKAGYCGWPSQHHLHYTAELAKLEFHCM